MFIMEKGKLYDGHIECSEANNCPHYRSKDKSAGCSGIMGVPTKFYCFYRENRPHIEIETGLVFVECNDESED